MNIRKSAGYVVGHALMLSARLVTAVRGEWRGVEPIPRQRVYFANHVSHADFVLIWTTLPSRLRYQARPVAGADYWLKSKLKRFIGNEVFRSVLIDRNRTTDAHATNDASLGADTVAIYDESKHADSATNPVTNPIAIMSDALHNGDSLILFPEGTRNISDKKLLPLKSGLYHLAKANPHVELVPVWINNLHRVLPKGEFIPVPLACTVTYGEAIELEAGEARDSFISRAEQALLQTSLAIDPACA